MGRREGVEPKSSAPSPPARGEVRKHGWIRESRLDNGVRVLTERMPGVRSAAVGVWVRQGGAHEGGEEKGISHLLEHLVFKGTEKRSAREISLALESLGGSLDAYTGREHTSYQARVLGEHVDEALEILSELVCAPTLRGEDLERERQVVLEEIATVEDTPDDLVFELHGERFWAGHALGSPILGTPESVAGLTREALASLHRERYLRPDLVVAATGHVNHGAVSEAARRRFGHLEGRAERPELPEPRPRRGGDERVPRETAQTHIVFGTDLPSHADPRRYGLVLLSTAFGGGMSSRLFQRVREELALAYTVYSYQSFYSVAGLAGVYVGTRPEWGDRAVEAIREEYGRLADEGLDPEEVERTKRQVKGQVMLSLEAPGSRLHRLAAFALYDEPFLTLDEVLERLDRITPGELAALAGEFYAPDRPFVLRLGG